MKQDWLKQAYRKWFAQLDEEVPEDIWAAIEDELDIDEVWTGVNEELSPRRRLSPWRWVGRAAAVFLFLLSGLATYYMYLFNPETGRDSFPDTGSSIAGDSSTETGRASTITGRKRGLFRNTGNPAIASLTERGINSIPGPSGKPFLSLVQAPPARLHDIVSSRMQQQTVPDLPEPENLLNGIVSALDKTTDPLNKDPFIRLQQLGLVSAYSNTWMLNHETFNGLQSSTLNATTVTYGASNGINAGFLIKGKHRLGAELYFSSRTGQRYQQYIEASYQSRNIQLDYYKLQLFYQLPVFSGRADVLTGAYASYLKRGREEIAGKAYPIGRFYRDIDYGLIAGFQVNLPINGKLQLHPGVRINYGLPNIFKGNQLIPDNFLRTHNAGIGFQLGFSYKLSD